MAVMTQATNPAPGIGRAFGEGLVTGYEDASDEKALQEAIHRLPKDASPQDILNTIVGTRASKEAKQDMLKNYMGVAEFEERVRSSKAQEETNRLNREINALKEKNKKDQEKQDALSLIDFAKHLSHDEKDILREKVKNDEASLDVIKKATTQTKEQIKEQEEQKEKDRTQLAFDNLVGLIPKVGLSNAPFSVLGGKTSEDFAAFSTLTGALESYMTDLVSRGRLTDVRFKYIVNELLPKPGDTQAKIKGNLKSIATMIGLDPGALGEENEIEQTKQDSEKIGNKPPLSSFKRK